MKSLFLVFISYNSGNTFPRRFLFTGSALRGLGSCTAVFQLSGATPCRHFEGLFPLLRLLAEGSRVGKLLVFIIIVALRLSASANHNSHND